MSQGRPPAGILEFVDLLLPEEPPLQQIYGRLARHSASNAPTLISDLFEFVHHSDRREPFDESEYGIENGV